MVEVHQLTKLYGSSLAVDQVTFQVKKGEILGFLGPNGAGKTTTMRMIAGFLSPTSGVVRVAGFDMATHPVKAKSNIGYLPENLPLYKELSVREFLHFILRARGIPPREHDSRMNRALERCGLTEVRRRLIGHLSKGFRQRVGLAQALIQDPEVLILDEPTGGLDPKQIVEFRELIKGLGRDRAVILSTHILQEVSQTSTRVIIIHEGKIVASDTFEALSRTLHGTNQFELMVARPLEDVLDRLWRLEGVVNVMRTGDRVFLIETKRDLDLRETLAELAVKEKWGLLSLQPVQPTLEDVFMKLTEVEK